MSLTWGGYFYDARVTYIHNSTYGIHKPTFNKAKRNDAKRHEAKQNDPTRVPMEKNKKQSPSNFEKIGMPLILHESLGGRGDVQKLAANLH